jgi:hypothetical protein
MTESKMAGNPLDVKVMRRGWKRPAQESRVDIFGGKSFMG